MQFGVCGSPETAASAAKAGYDFFETGVGGLLKPLESREAFAEALATHRSAALPCPVVNCFVPGSHKITGPEVDLQQLETYVQRTCERGKEAGIEIIVFGSGTARRIPEGFSREQAWQQLLAFGKICGPIAQAHGIIIVVEPLNLSECNVLTTIGEGTQYVREVDHPNFRLLIDAYHWGKDNDSYEALVEAGPYLHHAHIATYNNRHAPGGEACDFGPFFQALRASGYDGRLSIEGRLGDDLDETLPEALRQMRQYAANAQ